MDQEEQSDDTLNNPTTVYSAGSAQEAHFLKNLLIESGIQAMVSNEVLHRGLGVELVGLHTAAQVVVSAKDAEVARRLALEFDQRTIAPADPEVVYSATSLREAQAVSDALTQSGISAAIGDEVIQPEAQSDSNGQTGVIPVLVTRAEVEAARQIIFDGSYSRDVSSESVIAVPAPWPRCPQCDARRTTRCPICLTSGVEFEGVDPEFAGLPNQPDQSSQPSDSCDSSSCGSSCSCGTQPAESQSAEPEAELPGPDAGPARLTLMCCTCDEPFIPEFPSRCEWCGHEFADGYALEEHHDVEPIPAQAMIVIMGLVTLVLVACAYFAWLV
jgi:hypothetical protein